MSEAVLSIEGLVKRFGRTEALDGIDLVLERPGVYGFLGPNGAGKTTTFKLVSGLLRPTAGRIRIDGVEVGTRTARAVSHLGILFDSPAYYDYLTGAGNLEVFARWSGIDAGPRISPLLEMVGLGGAGRKKVGEYSWGMKRRLGIAAALLGDPKLLLLDEPTNGLDPGGIADIRRLLPHLAWKEGRTVLLSSHRMEEVSQICDHVTIIDRGRIAASGTPKELAGARSWIEVECADAERAAALLGSVPGIAAVERAGGERLRLRADGIGTGAVNRLLMENGIEVHHITERRESLEDIFFRLTGMHDDE
jgi:ABC-2 type transport system ATP-binding protein